MRKLYLLLISILFSYSASAQCVATITTQNNVCDSTCSAVIAVTFTGGSLPITIYLDDGTTQIGPFTVTTFWQYGNLCPGTYDIIATDMNGDTCTGNTTFTITSTPGPDANVVVSNATCTSCNDGAATATVTGGTPPYNYQWSNGATGGSIQGLLPGVYTLWVTDVNGCSDLDTFYVGVGSGGYYVLSGNIYFDLDSDGVKDAGETGIGNLAVHMTQGNITALTNSNGDYGIVVGAGNYDLNFVGAAGWNLTSVPATYNTTVVASSIPGHDFGVFPDSTVGSATVTITSGFPRCFWTVPYYLTLHNTGFTVLNGTMTFTHDLSQTFVFSNVVPVSQVGNVLTYDFINLGPGQTFTVMVSLTEPAGGTSVVTSLNATGSDGFGFQLNENYTLNQTINCSYDPNDKAVQPSGQGSGNYVAMNTWLDYTIRFQNTGTDTAFTVAIIDTIDAELDMGTFAVTSSSHPVNTTVRPGNEVTFTFDNILLPDSNVNEPASHGYVLYRIKGFDNNPDPTVITNTAYIYFDLNSPVQTNTTLTTFSDNWLFIAETGSNENLFDLFPNPTRDAAMLRLKSPSVINYSITIADISGRTVFGPAILENGSIMIPGDQLLSGTYIVEARPETQGKPVYMRLVKH